MSGFPVSEQQHYRQGDVLKKNKSESLEYFEEHKKHGGWSEDHSKEESK